VLEVETPVDIAREIGRTDSDPEGVGIMTQKGRTFLVRLDRVPLRAAPLLKQELLAAGADSAHARGVADLTVRDTRVVMLGTVGQYRRVLPKLRRQPFLLSQVGQAIDSALHHYTSHTPRKLPTPHHPLTVGDRVRVMGIVNITPDSFSDGGRFEDSAQAIEHAATLALEGADIVDLGGESTRPGARPTSPKEEWRRVGPVLEGVLERVEVPVSIDTRHAEVARKALDAGADIINDVSGLGSPAMRRLVARTGVPAILMHMRGTPATMQDHTRYQDLRQEVFSELGDRVDRALAGGVRPEQILLDPGLGFSKTPVQSLDLLRHVGEFRSLGFPLVVGASRKSFLGWALGGLPLEARFEASLTAAVVAALQGAEVVRVHDVQATVRAVRLVDALRHGAPVRPAAMRS
jgi:dihydropteroate synthase